MKSVEELQEEKIFLAELWMSESPAELQCIKAWQQIYHFIIYKPLLQKQTKIKEKNDNIEFFSDCVRDCARARRCVGLNR